jgi:oligopeptidase A
MNLPKTLCKQLTPTPKKLIKKDLKGLDENELVKLETENGYALNLQMPGYMAVMTYCESREIRKELYTAYISKASELDNLGEFNNTKTMNEILKLRNEFAKLLDFDNYAEYSLATKMTNSSSEVEEFLNNLIDKSKNQATNELKSLQEFADNYEDNSLNDELKPWDLGFYSEKQKQKEYGFSKSEIAEYFPFDKVLSGLLDLIEELYGH